MVVLVGAGVVFWPKPKPAGDEDIPEAILSQEKRFEMQRSLAAAEGFSNVGNYESAALNYAKVLREYDCNNREARRGLKAADDKLYEEVIAECSSK